MSNGGPSTHGVTSFDGQVHGFLSLNRIHKNGDMFNASIHGIDHSRGIVESQKTPTLNESSIRIIHRSNDYQHEYQKQGCDMHRGTKDNIFSESKFYYPSRKDEGESSSLFENDFTSEKSGNHHHVQPNVSSTFHDSTNQSCQNDQIRNFNDATSRHESSNYAVARSSFHERKINDSHKNEYGNYLSQIHDTQPRPFQYSSLIETSIANSTINIKQNLQSIDEVSRHENFQAFKGRQSISSFVEHHSQTTSQPYENDAVSTAMPDAKKRNCGVKAPSRDSSKSVHQQNSANAKVSSLIVGNPITSGKSAAECSKEKTSDGSSNKCSQTPPSPDVLAFTRYIDALTQVNYNYAKYQLLCQKLMKFREKVQLVESLPIGEDAFKEDLEALKLISPEVKYDWKVDRKSRAGSRTNTSNGEKNKQDKKRKSSIK